MDGLLFGDKALLDCADTIHGLYADVANRLVETANEHGLEKELGLKQK